MNVFRLLLMVLISASLISCATFKSPFDNSDPLVEFIAKPPRNGKGLVSLLVTPNSGKVDWRQATVWVRKLSAGGKYSGQPIRLLPVPLSTSSETVAYIGKLYPGRYSVTKMSQTQMISDFQAVTDVLSFSGEADVDALEFVVESDQLTDAGRVIVNSAANEWVAAWSSDRRAEDDIGRGNKAVAEYLSGFTKAAAVERSASQKEVQAIATRGPNGAFDIQQHAAYGIVAGSRLGAVLRRNDRGQWQRSRVGRFQRVLSLSEGDKGELLFAGDDNLLGYQFTSQQEIKFRYIDAGDIPPGQFTKVHWSAARGLLVMHQDGEAVRLYAAKSLKKPEWKLLAEVPQSPDVPNGVPSARLEVLGDYLAMAVFPNTIVSSQSVNAGWAMYTAPDDITDFQLRSGGVMRLLSINPYSGSASARDSETGGVGWRKLAIPSRTQVLPTQINDYEISLRQQDIGDDRVAVTLIKKSGADDRWRLQSRMPVGQFYALDDKHYFVVGSGFDVVRNDDAARAGDARDFVAFSADGGTSWVRERER